MVPSGIFIRSGFDGLAEQIVQRLSDQGPAGLKVEIPGKGEQGEGKVCVELSRWSDKWCRLEAEGEPEGVDLVLEALVTRDPLEEVLTSHFKPGEEEYSYTLFRGGHMMETFDSRGPGVESIRFISELRRVPLQTLMSASQFMTLSMDDHGLSEKDRVDGGETVLIDLVLPGDPSFLQSILGAAYRR
jgi:hypothetical protein